MRFQKNNPMRLFYRALFLAIMVVGIGACNKETTLGPPTSLSEMRSGINIAHADTSLVLSWSSGVSAWEGKDRPVVKLSYEVQISTDQTFSDASQTALDIVIDSTSLFLNDEQLTPLQNYYSRVRTITSTGTGSSDWVNASSFQLRPIDMFRAIKAGNLIDDAVILGWRRHGEMTDLTVEAAEGTEKQEFNIKDVTVISKLVEGLTPGKKYLAKLFRHDGRSLGVLEFTTKDVSGPGYTDLRGSADPLVLVNTLPNATAGTKLVLKRGMVYTFPTSYRFDKSITIMSEPGFGAPAHIQIASSLNVQATGTIDSIMFDDVKLTSSQSGYVFNISAEGKVGKLGFENCIISNHKGVIRIATPTPNNSAVFFEIGNYSVNNCIIEDLNDLGVMCVGNTNQNNVRYVDVSITNTTVKNSQRFLYFQGNKNSYQGTSCVVDNVTCYNVGSGRFWDFMNNGTFTSGIRISNTILGASGNPIVNSDLRGAAAVVTVNNSFVGPEYTGGVLTRFTATGVPSSAIFQNPATGNFSIINSNFNNVGDPRWRP